MKRNRMTELTAGDGFAPRPAPLPDLEPEESREQLKALVQRLAHRYTEEG